MPLIKKLTQFGNSFGIILDRPVLRQVDLTEESEVEISVQDGAIVIRPHRYASDADVKASARKMVSKHRRSLERLGQ